ncbi:MAG TPA: VIT1/CCC1 transporter family protein [Acidimicrobiales bacterium]|nr:VIT1/CCC1 transporter family protein [Acidimicrobiales bacterium]
MTVPIDADDDADRAHQHYEPHHRDVSGGWLRPSVFGAMDGLVTNVSLIAGVGGGGVAHHTVVLSGLAGLVAGAFSMATGEYTSVQSQNELVGAEVAVERKSLKENPDEERRELALSLARRGVDRELADAVAHQISANPEGALQFHAQEELGVDPDALPSPVAAAALSFASFASGALVPLVPFLAGLNLLWVSMLATAVALAATGAAVGRLTGRPMPVAAVRQVLLAVLSAGVTYGVGRLIGASVS